MYQIKKLNEIKRGREDKKKTKGISRKDEEVLKQ